MLLCILEAVEGRLCLLGGAGIVGDAGSAGGDALRAILYAGGCRVWALIAGRAGVDAPCAARGRGGWALFAGRAGGAGRVGRAGGDMLWRETLFAGRCWRCRS